MNELMFCSNCGVEMPNTAKYCLKCGIKTTAEDTFFEIPDKNKDVRAMLASEIAMLKQKRMKKILVSGLVAVAMAVIFIYFCYEIGGFLAETAYVTAIIIVIARGIWSAIDSRRINRAIRHKSSELKGMQKTVGANGVK